MNKLENLHNRLVTRGPAGVFEHGLFLLLRMLTSVYGLIVRLRGLTFDWGLRNVYRSSLPVIAVGNLAVGGTGKTPLVDLLIRQVQQGCLRVAVVSRGYAGKFSGDLGIVSLGNGPLLSVEDAGDEPSLLARRNPQAIVLIAAKRRIALEYVETQRCADLIILDDAFQHRQVARDLNLVLLDAEKPFGNQRLLPAGLLRESPSALSRADLICLTGAGDANTEPMMGKPVVRLRSALSDVAYGLNGEARSIGQFAALKVLAFAGIGRPERFFSALKISGISAFAELGLGDHVAYDQKIISQINMAAAGADVLLTTEKDAVKLSADNFDLPCYSVGLNLCVDDCDLLFEKIDALLKKDSVMPISIELLEILACPKCKGPVALQQAEDAATIICAGCRLSYPVRDGIPVMLIDEAKSLSRQV